MVSLFCLKKRNSAISVMMVLIGRRLSENTKDLLMRMDIKWLMDIL